MSRENRPIPVPFSVRIRHLVTQQLQAVLFIASVAGVIALWFTQRPRIVITGQVEAIQVVVPAIRDGVLEPIGNPLSRFDPVQKGVTPVALIETRQDLLEMQTLSQQREQLLAELESQRLRIRQAQSQWTWQTEQERRQRAQFQLDQDRSKLAIRQRVDDLTSDVMDLDQQRRSLEIRTRENLAALDTAKLSIETLIAERERIAGLVRLKMTPPTAELKIEQNLKRQQQALQAAQGLQELLQTQGIELAQQMAGANKRLSDATKQWADANRNAEDASTVAGPAISSSESDEMNVEALLQPYAQAIAVQDARIRELANRIASNQIVAPATGTIAEIHHPPGTFVRSGDPIMTIAADQRRWIVAYLDQRDRALLKPDTAVQIRVNHATTFVATSSVSEVGSHYEKVPTPLRADVNVDQWGVPIKIPIPAGCDVTPGQLVELVIQ